MILLINNYDSFSYNLYQVDRRAGTGYQGGAKRSIYPAGTGADESDTHYIVTGTGKTCRCRVCEDVVRYFEGKVPILGVCLGHQAICEVYGAEVSYAKHLMHGKMSVAKLDTSCPLFAHMGETAEVARYHSLAAVKDTIPDALKVVAETDDGEVMAVKHADYDIYGVQFHPESILTPEGRIILKNFLEVFHS